MSDLSRQVFIAQRDQLKAELEATEVQLRQQRQAQESAARISLAQAQANEVQVQQTSRQQIVDARVQQVNSLTQAINTRAQADALVFESEQNRLAAQVEMDAEASQLSQAERQQRLQLQQRTQQAASQAASQQVSNAGRGGSSSQVNASIRGSLNSLAAEQANVNRDISGQRSRLDTQSNYLNTLMGVESRLARNQAARLNTQADVNQGLSEELSQLNISTARTNQNAASLATNEVEIATQNELNQSSRNFADTLRQAQRSTSQQISNLRSTIL